MVPLKKIWIKGKAIINKRKEITKYIKDLFLKIVEYEEGSTDSDRERGTNKY